MFQQWAINISSCFLFESSRKISVLFHVAKTIAGTPCPDLFFQGEYNSSHCQVGKFSSPPCPKWIENFFNIKMSFSSHCHFSRGSVTSFQISWLSSTLPSEHAIVWKLFYKHKISYCVPLVVCFINLLPFSLLKKTSPFSLQSCFV